MCRPEPAPIHDMDLAATSHHAHPVTSLPHPVPREHTPDLRSCPVHTGTLEPARSTFHALNTAHCTTPSPPTSSRGVRVLPDSNTHSMCSDCVQIPFEICMNFYLHERIILSESLPCSFQTVQLPRLRRLMMWGDGESIL